jgi:biopolymer transport protein ExbD
MPLKSHLDDEPTMNLTAMLDVMFLLIIFFMLGTKFVEDEERNIALNVPAVTDSRDVLAKPPACKVVHVDNAGNIMLGNGRDQFPVSLEELTNQLTAEQKECPKLSVVIRGDAENKLQRMAEVLNACKQAGIRDLNLTVRAVSSRKQ